jgi:hypothetical protein
MEKSTDKKYKNQYMIAYHFPPGTEKIHMLKLHTENYEEAIKISKCIFGPKGPLHLYYKRVEI